MTCILHPPGPKGQPGISMSTPGPRGEPGPHGVTGRPGVQGEQHHSQHGSFGFPCTKLFEICFWKVK